MRSGVRCRVLQAEARLWSQQVIYSVQQLQDSSCSGTMRHWQRAAGMPTVAWSERRYDCVFCTLCLDSCPPPPTVYLSYTLFPFSCRPLCLPLFFQYLQRGSFSCFSASVFLQLDSPVTPLTLSRTPISGFLGHICPHWLRDLKIIPPALWHTDPCR